MSGTAPLPRPLPLVIVRPEPGCAATLAAARSMGFDARGFALFAVEPAEWAAPDPADFDVVLAGSANVFRLGGPELARLAGLPVHAVGETTADAARAAGFLVAATGAGGLQPVLTALAPGTRALRLAGAERVALTPPPGVTMVERTVYAARPLSLPDGLVQLLREPAAIALHSAEAARHFAAQVDRVGIARAHLALVTIGPRVTAAAGSGWATVLTADSPSDPALLAKARDLCQTAGKTSRGPEGRSAAMPDENFSDSAAHEAVPGAGLAPPAPLPRPARRGGTILLGLIVAFLLGAAGIAYAAWQGLVRLPAAASSEPATPEPLAEASPAPRAAPPAPAAAALPSLTAQQDQLEARVAALSARLDALTVSAQSAASNAGRAEALLVAFAARRALDRGAPLNTLEDQLRLRFGDSQPHAVTTVIETAREPVTLDQLLAGLDTLAPALVRTPAEGGAWTRIREGLASLFVIRHEDSPSPGPQATLDRARVLLESGRTGDAIDELARLPGATGAGDWFAAARRYDDARRALDVLETSALIGTPPASRNAAAPSATAPAT